MSILSNKIFWELLALLSSMTELTENVTCRRFSDLVYLKRVSRKLPVTLYIPCLMCIRELYDQQ